MKLYFKQKVFSFKQHTDIFDESGNVLFTAEGEIFSLGRKMHIYDRNRYEVGLVQQKLLRLMPRFSVFINGQYMADVVREFTLFKQNYRVEGLGWRIDGDFLAHDYRITYGGKYIASIHKHWMTWGDSFEIDIAYEQDTVMALAVIIAIDCVMDTSQSSNSN